MTTLPISLSAVNGSLIVCNTPPSISPCLGFGDYACWNSSSNCWGGILNITDGRTAIIPGPSCTVTLCPLGVFEQANFNYLPTVLGNGLFAGIFCLLLVAQILLAFRWRTWSFLVGIFFGLVLEVVGYIGRILIHDQPFARTPFLIYLICLTLAPAFLSASIYLCLSRIIITYGTGLSRFGPKTYTIAFVSCDVVSLVLQAIGGALASAANTSDELGLGTNVMIAGLSWQVASLILFVALYMDFALRFCRSLDCQNPAKLPNVLRLRFRLFLWALGLATLAVFIRSVFRVAELSQGFHGPLANQEVTFMVLEGIMIIIACVVLTVFHPGYALGERWVVAKPCHKGRLKEQNSGSAIELCER